MYNSHKLFLVPVKTATQNTQHDFYRSLLNYNIYCVFGYYLYLTWSTFSDMFPDILLLTDLFQVQTEETLQAFCLSLFGCHYLLYFVKCLSIFCL